jgi:hypothetical protein
MEFIMATFHQRTISVNSKTLYAKWYEVTGAEMTIATATANLPKYGTNASFFGGTVMTAIHVVGGQAVRTGGLNNFADSDNPAMTKMSALYCRLLVSTSVAFSYGVVNLAETYSDVPQPSPNVGSTLWAIGGITLILNETMNSLNDMISRYREIYNPIMVDDDPPWIPNVSGGRARTFIGYTSDFKVLFGVLSPGFSGSSITDNSVTLFDMYKVLKTNLGCSMALNIDGGNSSKIRYKNSTGTTVEAEVNGNRNVLCQLALTDSAATNCNWNGQ